MPPPFFLEYTSIAPGKTPAISVTQDANGLRIRSAAGQNFWDTAQTTLGDFQDLLRMAATLHVRLDMKTRDHCRTYCTVRSPDALLKYMYKFYCGVGEWVATETPGPGIKTLQVLPEDFYGRRAAPIDLARFWGLNGLLRHTWYTSHSISCHSKHYDIFINIIPAGTNTMDPYKLIDLCGFKRITHLQVCADAKVATLFQVLIGLDRSTKLDSLAHCLAKIYKPNRAGEDVTLGKEYLFEDAVRSGVTMEETGWFVSEECCALISSKRSLLSSKFRHTFMFEEIIEM